MVLGRAVVRRLIVEIEGGRAANNSLYDACPRLTIVGNRFHGKEVATLSHRRACAGASVFVVVGVAAPNRRLEHQCM